MNKRDVDLIRRQKGLDRRLLSDFLKSQSKRLTALCLHLGGHEWSDWFEYTSYSIGGHLLHTHSRVCMACDKKEWKTEE